METIDRWSTEISGPDLCFLYIDTETVVLIEMITKSKRQIYARQFSPDLPVKKITLTVIPIYFGVPNNRDVPNKRDNVQFSFNC